MIQLILGGARSGKSSYAEQLAKLHKEAVCYIATATAKDDEMIDRIKYHKRSRPRAWSLVEEPFKLSHAIFQAGREQQTILVDCLTLWLSNWICLVEDDSSQQQFWQQEKQQLVDVLAETKSNVILVSNEVGSGIVPLGQLSREFVDQAGWLNQHIAQVANRVVLVTAGLPLELKNVS
ncbi:MAG: bifunctional adenosylcobinamide kinase/adenosylcobinamide-phosphate guanylyltransferase [Kangiellaceae bacterium]|nr:bifunctional adenosylcobinamide kinase/adenosylcobinamide-phosphate guanylyltransferase [Kangiellaceae bacterium]